jgi:transposase
MSLGRPLAPLELSQPEQEQLLEWTRRPKTAQALALRARIVLLSAQGRSNTEIARRLHISLPTTGKWRQRFLDQRLDGLLDEPRPGTPRRLSDAEVERVLARTLETQPQAATHWSTRSLAQATGLSQSSISRIWRAFSLQPHRSQSFKLSRDPLFIDKVRDIVGLYLNPPDRALVLCVDEKSQIQALDRTAPLLPHASRADRAPQPRLHPPRHHQPVCCLRCRQWPRTGSTASPPSLTRVPAVSRHHRSQCARPT